MNLFSYCFYIFGKGVHITAQVPITVHFDHGTSKLELMEAIVLVS